MGNNEASSLALTQELRVGRMFSASLINFHVGAAGRNIPVRWLNQYFMGVAELGGK